MFKFGNPSVRRWANKTQSTANTSNAPVNYTTATYGGVVGKSALLLGITILSAIVTMLATWYGIFQFVETGEISQGVITGFIIGTIVAVVLMVVCSIVISVSPKLAKIFGPIYAVIQGAFLGFIAAFLEMIIPFVTLAALLGTVIVFVVCILMYKVIGVRIKSNFLRVLAISFMCFALLQLIVIPIMLFTQIAVSSTAIIWIQAIASFLCILFAAITIIYDLQTIDSIVQGGADKNYEWGVAFSLVTSLVYLYLQILQLLLRILALFGSKKK